MLPFGILGKGLLQKDNIFLVALFGLVSHQIADGLVHCGHIVSGVEGFLGLFDPTAGGQDDQYTKKYDFFHGLYWMVCMYNSRAVPNFALLERKNTKTSASHGPFPPIYCA